MERKLTISEARARLPELARKVVSEPGAVEYIAHRDLPDDLALTAASHIRALERTITELRKKLEVTPFKLAGSIVSALDDDELEATLARLRAEQRVQNAQRLEELGE